MLFGSVSQAFRKSFHGIGEVSESRFEDPLERKTFRFALRAELELEPMHQVEIGGGRGVSERPFLLMEGNNTIVDVPTLVNYVRVVLKSRQEVAHRSVEGS